MKRNVAKHGSSSQALIWRSFDFRILDRNCMSSPTSYLASAGKKRGRDVCLCRVRSPGFQLCQILVFRRRLADEVSLGWRVIVDSWENPRRLRPFALESVSWWGLLSLEGRDGQIDEILLIPEEFEEAPAVCTRSPLMRYRSFSTVRFRHHFVVSGIRHVVHCSIPFLHRVTLVRDADRLIDPLHGLCNHATEYRSR